MEIFKLFGSVLVDTAEAEKSISKTGEKAEGLGSKLGGGIKTAAKWGAAIAAGAAAAGAAVFAFTNKIADNLGALDDAAQRAGVTAEAYQEYAYAAAQSGIEANALEKAMVKAQKAFADAKDGSVSMSEAYRRLGIDINEVGNSSDAFDLVVSKLASMEDETLRNALANDIFGKSYAELTPLFNQGAEGIEALKMEARDLGAVMSNEAVTAGADFGDMVLRVQTVFAGLGNQIAVQFMPILQSMMGWIVERAPEIQAIIGEIVVFIQESIAGLQAFWEEHGATISATVSAVWDTIKTVIDIALTIIGDWLSVFAALFSGNWNQLWESVKNLVSDIWESIKTLVRIALEAIVGILAGIWESMKAAAKEVFYKVKEGFSEVWEDITTWFSEAVEKIVSTVTNIGSKLFDAGKTIFNRLWDGIKSIWEDIKNWISEKVEWIADKLAFWRSSASEMDSSSGSGMSGSHAAGLPFVPYDGYIAELHRGETVLSADSTHGLIEGIVNGVAGVVNGISGNQQPIVVNVSLDKKTIARTIFDPLRDVAKQRGVAFG